MQENRQQPRTKHRCFPGWVEEEDRGEAEKIA